MATGSSNGSLHVWRVEYTTRPGGNPDRYTNQVGEAPANVAAFSCTPGIRKLSFLHSYAQPRIRLLCYITASDSAFHTANEGMRACFWLAGN